MAFIDPASVRCATPAGSWLLATMLAVSLSGCRTPSSRTGSAVKEVGASLTAPLDMSATLTLGQDAAQALYLRMATIETQAGMTPSKGELHTARGLVECHKDGSLKTCLVRIRLADDNLSATQLLPDGVPAQAWSFVRAKRPEIGQEPYVVTDVTCDYRGKQSPPYDGADVRCQLALPRVPGEAVFADQAAEDLSEALREDRAFGTDILTLGGSVVCQWLDSSPRTPCLVRTIGANGTLGSTVHELNPQSAGVVARQLRQAALDREQLARQPAADQATPPPTAPHEVMGALTCLVDGTALKNGGRRSFVCRAKT